MNGVEANNIIQYDDTDFFFFYCDGLSQVYYATISTFIVTSDNYSLIQCSIQFWEQVGRISK